jgi:hypothetical protein
LVRGLDPDTKSFLWKLATNIVPVGERLFRLNKKQTPNCPSCYTIADRRHLLDCHLGKLVSDGLKKCLTECFLSYDPQSLPLMADSILYLQLEALGPATLAATWLVGAALKMIYKATCSNNAVNKFRFQAMMKEAANTFKNTTFSNTSIYLTD